MLLLIHGPGGPFQVVAARDGTVYWKAGDVFRALNVAYFAGRRIVGDRFVRASDLGISHSRNLFLTSDRVWLLLLAFPRGDFRRWFEDVSSGRSLLCPRNPVEFDAYVRLGPFGPYHGRGSGLLVDCTDSAPGQVRLGYVFDLPNLAAMVRRPPPDPRDVDELLARELSS